MVVARPGKSKKSVPYNAYVARDRQEKYYTRKKTLSKFKRFQRYAEKDENNEKPKGSTSKLMDRLLQEDPDAMEAEYERRLALSFGDVPTEATAAEPEGRQKRRKKPRGDDDGTAVPVEEQPIVKATRRKKLRHPEEDAEEEARAEAPTMAVASGTEDTVAKARKKAKVRKGVAEGSAPSDKKGAKAAKCQSSGGSASVPMIYAKAMRQYEEAQAAKAAEHQRKQDEIQEQNRRRKAHAKTRAMNYQLLSQKTQRGQPNMQSRLDMMLSKLGVEGNRRGSGDHRGNEQSGIDRSARGGRSAGHKRQR